MKPTAVRWHPTLPIFRLTVGEQCILYTPGNVAVVTASQSQAMREAWFSGRRAPVVERLAAKLETSSRGALEAWRRRIEVSFKPECLTIYPTRQCNLACRYCYSHSNTSTQRSDELIDEPVIRQAARQVAAACAAAGKSFSLVVHGGGEPTLDTRLLERIVDMTRAESETLGVSWFGYIATNGVVAGKRVSWLAEHFDLIGLSCDGPPDIQNRHRPLAGGAPSSPWVERSARTIAAAGGGFVVRATVTPGTMARQAEMVDYFYSVLAASQVRIEPVYGANGIESEFRPEHAEPFVTYFLDAQHRARVLGIDLRLASVRLDELHGPHCNVLKNVLQITPDGAAMGCFLYSDVHTPGAKPVTLGRWDANTGSLDLDEAHIQTLRLRAAEIPEGCKDCVNAYHCARECPEKCYLDGFNQAVKESDDTKLVTQDKPGFRCLVQRSLAEHWILEAAKPLLTHSGISQGQGTPCRRGADETVLIELLSDCAGRVDVDAIVEQWRALPEDLDIGPVTLPLPIWARHGFSMRGTTAWQHLRNELPHRDDRGPMSIYLHVPFCDRRCGFCNSLSRPLGQKNRRAEEDYVRVLLEEIRLWSKIAPLHERPVTTIHFGGGTPNYLRPSIFECVIEELQTHFSVTPSTEWALESTSSLLSGTHLSQLQQWGFSRLHVGVQTLEDYIRRLVGRREPAEAVVGKLSRAMDMGFIVSVDVLYGLPKQTLLGLLKTLQWLVSMGIHGVSVYGLQVTELNRKFMAHHGGAYSRPLRDYAYFQIAEQYLRRTGYAKTHFTHFALPTDTNLYYSFPQRGEDLLALGPTADGVFGDFHYRHPDLDEYLAERCPDLIALEGGVREPTTERHIRPAVTELMASSITEKTFERLGAAPLLQYWLDARLIEQEKKQFTLTANGSWFITRMIGQLAESVSIR